MRMRKQVVAPVVTFLAVAVAVGTAAVLTGGSGTSDPRPLRLAGARALDAAALAPGSGSYALVGTLPSGTPADAPAWLLADGPADADLVARLADALKAGAPVRDGDGWRAGNLVVSGAAGRSWAWSPCAGDTPVSSDATPVPCAVAGTVTAVPGASGGSSGSGGTGTGTADAGSPPAVVEPPPVPASTVTGAATPVLAAVGLDVADGRVTTTGYGGSVTVDRRVGGLDTVGLVTRVDVGPDGSLSSASGWLAPAREGDSYPLVSARQAFDALPPLARPMLACPVGPDGQGCLEPKPVEITGAHLGLSLQPLADGGQVLVPSWLFEVKGAGEPVVGVAVQPRYLPGPSPDRPASTEPASTEPASTEPGSAPPEPGSVPPASTEPGSTGPRSTEPGSAPPASTEPAPPATKPVPSPS